MSAESRVQSDSSRWSTRQLVTMALFCALATVLSFIEFPIFPAAPFLKYDASFVPVMVGGFAYGAGPGIIIGVVTALTSAIGLVFGGILGEKFKTGAQIAGGAVLILIGIKIVVENLFFG